MSNRIGLHHRVKELVAFGITSPTALLRSLPEVKNWRTARKYIQQARAELVKNSLSLKEEFSLMLTHLQEHRSELLLHLKDEKHINQRLGILARIAKIDDQIIKLIAPNAQIASEAALPQSQTIIVLPDNGRGDTDPSAIRVRGNLADVSGSNLSAILQRQKDKSSSC